MTQRNPMNPRSQNKPKGKSRKSASSAKLVHEAGASVHASASSSKDQRTRRKQAESKEREERQKERQREAALGAGAQALPEYKRWRKVWWITIVVAIVGVGLSWLFTAGVSNGILPASFSACSNIVSIIGLVIGYGGIIYAFYIDFRKIRPIRKQQEARAHNLSKRQKRELDAAIAKNDKEYQSELQSGKGFRMPWSKKNGVPTDSKGNVADAKKGANPSDK